jgi:methylmalonyl-CoA mutase cobalamin-binding subunit
MEPVLAAAPAWAELLGRAIESEILPRLLSTQRAMADDEAGRAGMPDHRELAAFLDLVIADDMEQVRAVADRVIVQSGGREALLDGLLTPAARLLGRMWEQDLCDFMTVTLGVYRLDQIMKETALAGQVVPLGAGFDHRILLLPAPGEQHSFGLGMVADAFREGGWCVRSGPAVTRNQLLRLVRDEWFDVIGISVTTERWLRGLAACIRAARRASCNPRVCIMLGGYAVVNHAERNRFLGADAIAYDARDALRQAEVFVETTVTGRLSQSKTQLVDAG